MRIVGLISTVMACWLAATSPAWAAASRTHERDGFTLVFSDPADAMDQAVADRMVETFFAVYPRLTERFNPRASRRVTFVVDPNLGGVAGVGGDHVFFNPAYFDAHPEDTDVVVHEAMHVVQAYGDQPVPGWLVEGIADYVRHHYGVNDHVGGWRLPDYASDQDLGQGYRSTGRFLVWLEQHGHPDLVRSLDEQARAGTYTPEVWVALTGEPLEALWAAYSADPDLDPASSVSGQPIG